MQGAFVLRTLVVQRARPQEDGSPSPRLTPDRCSPHPASRGAARWLTDRPFSVWPPIPTRALLWLTSERSGRVHQPGAFDLVAAAVLVKGIDGKLQVDRYDTTATHRSWGCALLGSALAVVAAPLAVVPLSGVATQDGTWAGVGGIVEHFWHNIPKGQLLRMSDLLESGQAALVVVVIDHTQRTSKHCCRTQRRRSSPRRTTATSSRRTRRPWPERNSRPDEVEPPTRRVHRLLALAEATERRNRRWTSSVSVLPVTMHTTFVASTSSAPPAPSRFSRPMEHPR